MVVLMLNGLANSVHPSTQYADGVINLCMKALESGMREVMADWEVEEHILGLVMVQHQQYCTDHIRMRCS